MLRTGAVAQSYRERRPAAAPADLVGCVWLQTVAPGASAYTHRTIPNGSVELVCPVGGLPWVVGPQTAPREDTLAPGSRVVGVRFRPGAGAAALGLPAAELVDRTVDAAELWGRAAAEELGERVAAAAAPAAALERHVASRLAGARPDPVARAAVGRLHPWAPGELRALAASLFISERQLRRRFEAAVGLPPKVLQRMVRFQAFLALAHHQGLEGGALARLAAEAGFADQSHLAHESQRLAGQPPGALLREAAEHCAPGHDHAASYAPLLRLRATS